MSQIFDFATRNFTQRNKRFRKVPPVIKDIDLGISGPMLLLGNADQSEYGSLAQRLVSSERNQVVQRDRLASQELEEKPKHLGNGSGSGTVWNDNQYSLSD
jgi:hypothetical protein